MNKYINSFVFLSHLLFFNHIMAVNAFEKLTPSITRNAQAWVESIHTLSDEMQLAYLNLFALHSENSIPAFIKCAEYIESQSSMLPSYEQLGSNIMQKIKKYYDSVQEKIARKKNLTQAQEETLWQKLEMKIQELVAYINQIYYETLYNYIAQKDPSAVICMFDENGVIPQEKRTQRLPQPE